MDEQQRKQQIKNTFNTVSEGYDNQALRFFMNSAHQLPAIFGFKGNEHILDVATGTGIAALELARAVPQGKVTGIDFSEGMLTQARSKASSPPFSLSSAILNSWPWTCRQWRLPTRNLMQPIVHLPSFLWKICRDC